MIPFISYFYLQGRYDLALMMLLIAGFSDFFDGALARRYQWRTKLGAVLDPAADKFLMFVTYITLGWTHQLPFWSVAIVIFRDVYIVMGVLFLKLKKRQIPIRPILISKLNTFFQLALLSFSLLYSYVQMHQFLFLDYFENTVFWAKQIALFFVLVFTLASGIHYTVVGWGILKKDV
ncbi:MAG: CDP-alcohol phosphatidyltransferase family protein [Deltaproteobacteria bacterium]|nr:CDP-alcohol phosphatidyltransferase family protein [Deltaproteobacteria bacterium]